MKTEVGYAKKAHEHKTVDKSERQRKMEQTNPKIEMKKKESRN